MRVSEGHAALSFDVGDNAGQCVPVIGIAGQSGDVGDELPTLAPVQRRRDRDLHAELVGTVRLALADC
jgi:hypothetical protein